jgi:hypothetical protein
MHMEIWCTFAHIEFWPSIPYPTFCDGSKDENGQENSWIFRSCFPYFSDHFRIIREIW